MKKNIHFFSSHDSISDPDILESIGIRGRRAMELGSIDLPILPGFIIDSEVAAHLKDEKLKDHLKTALARIERIVGKKYGDPANPMLVKIVISPNLVIVHYPTMHNFGLCENNLAAFNSYVGENFGYHEMEFMMKGCLEIEARIAELQNREKDLKAIKDAIKVLGDELKDDNAKVADRKKTIQKYQGLLPKNFFADPYDQLEIALKRISLMLDLDEMDDDDTALIIQPMVYGNYGKDSASGMFFTRDIVTGAKNLTGEYFQERFDDLGAAGMDINKIAKNYHDQLKKVAQNIEDHYKEIRSIRFTIENKRMWLIDQRGVMNKSTQADIQLLLDLLKRKVIQKDYAVRQIKPNQLGEILHPIIDINSVKTLKTLPGGIGGAPGAAIGQIYFDTEELLDAYKKAQQSGEDTRFILCLPATFAEDVKAIEVATGVLSNEGGYSAHASVVARQYGKVSLVNTKMKIRDDQAVIGNVVIKKGDFLTLNVPYYGDPSIYLGKAGLIEPDPESSGLLEFNDIVSEFMKDFEVRANADTPKDTTLARTFGAHGIGLCRTEHMFFDEKRINVFREMVISDSVEERREALNKLKPMQRADFYKLFKIMEGFEVTIRLLDAPLHEFLPHNTEEMKKFIAYLRKQPGKMKISEAEVQARCTTLNEFNPMLGHRGCRIAISYPEIYEMQMRAIFEAVYALRKEGVKVMPEIMIPIVMNDTELKMIVYGKKIEGASVKGLIDIEKEVREKLEVRAVPYRIGTMIELPVAALGAGDIAKYAEFFSFGTNDLTQTTIGLSRDDFNSFMPDYTQFDLLEGNPFKYLDKYVKELITIAVRRGTMTRPNLKKGLCGEHGAVPENIKFCMQAGLDYVSCSSYSVPIAKLAVARINLGEE
ncbi:MAG: pyruvate, phosphate dikinase [Spirochaetaceae bacterium]|nr:MAG: pyruvate, phosphate dikinase [Spirochaetaceae bacterium]